MPGNWLARKTEVVNIVLRKPDWCCCCCCCCCYSCYRCCWWWKCYGRNDGIFRIQKHWLINKWDSSRGKAWWMGGWVERDIGRKTDRLIYTEWVSEGVREWSSEGVREWGSEGVREWGSQGVREWGSDLVIIYSPYDIPWHKPKYNSQWHYFLQTDYWLYFSLNCRS